MTSFVIWIFGLPCAGKTTIADALRDALAQRGITALRLDGDQLRKGLCKGLCNDLGFSLADSTENIRRAANVAKLAAEAGIPTIASLITPTQELRDLAATLIGDHRFLPVFIACPSSECARRDVKGLYAKAKAGQLTGLTGADGSFEVPGDDVLTVHSDTHTASECVEGIVATMSERGWL